MMIRALILALLLVFSSVPVASVALADPPAVQSPQTNGILANIQAQYKTAATGWISAMQNAAKHIFQGLVAIELVWSFVWWTYEKGVDGFITSLLKKVMGLSFYWAIILNAPTWIPQIIATFGQIGATASNVSSLNPGNVFDLGIQIATQIAAAASKQASVTDPGTVAVALVSYIAALMVVLAFVVVALSLLITLIETYFVISAGMVLLGFAGSRWTSQFAEKYFSANVSVGLKLMMTYLVIGVGQSITTGWTSKISGSQPVGFQDIAAMLGASVIYAGIVWKIPSMAAGLLSGSASLTLGGVGAAAGGMVAGAAGLVAGVAAGAAGAAGAAAGAAKGVTSSVSGAIQAGRAAMAASGSYGGGVRGAAAAVGDGVRSSATAAGQSLVRGIADSGARTSMGRLAGRIDQNAAARDAAPPAKPPNAPPPNAPPAAPPKAPAGGGTESGVTPPPTTPPAQGEGPAPGASTPNADSPPAPESSATPPNAPPPPTTPPAQEGGPAPGASTSPSAPESSASSSTPRAKGTRFPASRSAVQKARDVHGAIRRAVQTIPQDEGGGSISVPLKHHE